MFFAWACFVLSVLALLALDLGVFNRRTHVIGVKEALGWTFFWVFLALAFNAAVYFMYENCAFGFGGGRWGVTGGRQAVLQYFAGYVIEKSLSVDNIFVIALIFDYFSVPRRLQHRTLYWGITGALLMRGAMIGGGLALLHMFEWVTYVFGAILFVSAVKLLLQEEKEIEPDRNPLVRLARRFYPVASGYEEERFFTRLGGRRAITPLFLVLLVVESSDVMFAVDSIPAIFAVTRDPFIVFTSNVFAILGLRSLYFALAAIMNRFRYLRVSIVLLLAFVGVKMVLSHHYPISTGISLGVICAILSAGVAASLIATRGGAPPVEAAGG
ncbi:MAG: TerC family protein [bacterium]